jgi:Raf kinase inhibitor-like YbhB/YbcL family protein
VNAPIDRVPDASDEVFVRESSLPGNTTHPVSGQRCRKMIFEVLAWGNVPDGVTNFVLIAHDVDAAVGQGTDDMLHWMVWNIPASANGIPEGSLPPGSVQGANITGQNAYFGPGAPAGPRYHHYVFELYALNANLDLPATASRDDLMKAMAGKTVAKSAYVGRFRGNPPQ